MYLFKCRRVFEYVFELVWHCVTICYSFVFVCGCECVSRVQQWIIVWALWMADHSNTQCAHRHKPVVCTKLFLSSQRSAGSVGYRTPPRWIQICSRPLPCFSHLPCSRHWKLYKNNTKSSLPHMHWTDLFFWTLNTAGRSPREHNHQGYSTNYETVYPQLV